MNTIILKSRSNKNKRDFPKRNKGKEDEKQIILTKINK